MRRDVTQILFVQGAGENVHDQWDDRLVTSLRRALGPDYDVRYPRMPNESDPRFASWRDTIEKEMATLRAGAMVVGHSVGGAVLINALADHHPPVALGAIFLLAAPFIGDGGWESEDMARRPDLAARLPHDVPIHLYHGESDTVVPVAHVGLYADAIPLAHVHRLAGRDHQFGDDLSEVANEIRRLESR